MDVKMSKYEHHMFAGLYLHTDFGYFVNPAGQVNKLSLSVWFYWFGVALIVSNYRCIITTSDE